MNGPTLDVARLRALVAVAREGSVTGAAGALHYSQPSISHHLARLEMEAGVPLVQRAGRGIRLTEAGRLLADRAEEILGRLEAARAEVAALAGLRAGRARLAAFPSALATIVPRAAARLETAYPGLDLSLVDAEPLDALRLLRNGDVDVALFFEHGNGGGQPRRPGGDATRSLTVTELVDEPLYIVTAAGRRWAGPRSQLATYAAERWIAGCERCREHLVSSCADAGFVPNIAYQTDDYVAVQALVAAGIGVSTLPRLALKAHKNPEVRVHRLTGEVRRVLVATYGAQPAPVPAQALVSALRTSF